MNRTIAHMNADMHRAEQEGARAVFVNLQDLKEVLSLAESAAARERHSLPVRSAGWVKPGNVISLKAGERCVTKIRRRKCAEYNTELFFVDDLHEKAKEADAARELAAEEAL